jgi:Pyruvate/2-oxoacid:ferredoxin oxidoreductase gamma subunit
MKRHLAVCVELRPMPIPMLQIAARNGTRVMMNTAGTAAVAGVMGLPFIL